MLFDVNNYLAGIVWNCFVVAVLLLRRDILRLCSLQSSTVGVAKQ